MSKQRVEKKLHNYFIMFFVLVFLSFVGLSLVATQGGVGILAALLGFTVLVVGVVAWSDLVALRQAIRNLVDGKLAYSSHDAVLLSGAGRDAIEQVQALSVKLSALSWQNEAAQQSPHALGDAVREIVRVMVNDSSPDSEAAFFNQLFELISRNFRANAMAVVTYDQAQPEVKRLKINQRGVEELRFEVLCRRNFEDYFNAGQLNCFGLRDGLDSDSVFGEFSVLGFRYTLAYPFVWGDQATGRRAVVWLGYDGTMAPTSYEVTQARELADKLGAELRTKEKVLELSGKVAEAATLDREKNEFIAQMSHDIRSPLNNIKSILNLLQAEQGGGSAGGTENGEMIEIALNNCETMGEIVEDILDLSKHRAGKLAAHVTRVNLAECVQGVVESFAVTARMKGLVFRLIDVPERCYVDVDKRQMKRIVQNLVSNAIKYTSRGSVSVTVKEFDREHWCVSVLDTGSGMTESQLERLFTPFTRFHGSNIEGIGLGLALTKILLGINKGEIQVRSKEGVGSQFSIIFLKAEAPAQVESVSISAAMPARAVVAGPVGYEPSLLLVDDDLDCVESLARNFAVQGYRVLKAFTVSDAISILNFDEPDLIITDASMPDGGGKRIIEFVRKAGRSAPVVVLSGHDGATELQSLKAAGANFLVSKPVDFPVLEQMVRASLAEVMAA